MTQVGAGPRQGIERLSLASETAFHLCCRAGQVVNGMCATLAVNCRC